MINKCLRDLTGVTLAFEDANSELLDVVSTAGVGNEECVDDSLVKILKLRLCRDFEAEFRSGFKDGV